MTIPYKPFQAAGADVGAGVTETCLNRFAVAHFKAAPSVYSGKQEFDDFDQKVTVDFAALTPLVFDLAPISQSRFAKIWVAHLQAIGSSVKQASDLPTVPPNLSVSVDKMKFVVTVFKKDGTIDFSIPFVWHLSALCAVLLVDASGNSKAVRLSPIKVQFSQSQTAIANEIRTKLVKIRRRAISAPTHHVTDGPGDKEWCIKLEKLFIFIINQVLSRQLASFIAQIDLPRAIDLVAGVKIAPFMLDIDSDTLLVGGRVLPAATMNTELMARLDGLMIEFKSRYESEFVHQDIDLAKWRIDRSPTFRWLAQKVSEAEAEARKHRQSKRRKSRSRAPENIFLLSNDALFDQIAKTYLQIYQAKEYQSPEFLGFRAVAGYWFKLSNGHARVISQGIDAGADFAAHGHAGIQERNWWDPKHWGQWEDIVDLCIDLKPKPPLEVDAFPTFKSDGIYLHCLLLHPDEIVPSWCGNVPGIIPGLLLSWIIDIVSRVLLDLLKLVIAMIVVKIADYPTYFPGTPLKWTPNMNQTPSNNGPYLTFSGDSQFSP